MNKRSVILGLVSTCLSAFACAEVSLESIELPPGFRIAVYAKGVANARQMALGDAGTVFVGSREGADVYALTDADGDQVAERVRLIPAGLDIPSGGVAFRDGALYVGALDRILRYDDIEGRLDEPPEPTVVTDSLPDRKRHARRSLAFGPEGWLYVPIGAPCNVCDEPGFAEIRRMRPDGTSMQTFAEGVRNSVGLAFHPQTGELWFTDNGRDWLGDDLPSCELNHAPRPGLHFGFPYCHQGDVPDPEFGDEKSCSDYRPPALKLGPHVAPLGLTFYTGDMFPEPYHHQLFVAEHGSWNRSEKIGYRVKLVRFGPDGKVAGQEVFASGWLQGEHNWGRPNDVLVMPDGALLVSDDQAGVIYRISYAP